MSILGDNTDPLFSSGAAIFFMVVLVVSCPVAVWLGVFRPRAVAGPLRLRPDRPVFPLAISMAMAFFAMIVVAGLYASWKHIGVPRVAGGPPSTPDVIDQAFLFSMPPLVSVYVLCIADYMLGGPDIFRRLGVTPDRFPGGVLKGLLAAVVIIPPTYAVSILTEWVYHHVHFSHPNEHELLTLLTQEPSHPIAHWVLIFSAVVIAPFSEEFFFRGHLQTLIQRMLVVISSPRRGQTLFGFPVLHAGFPLDAAPPVAPPIPIATAVEVAPPRPMVWHTWLAILLTSCIFAWAHPLWMRPPIFFLALGLGYCYERTGNLWTNITVHCLFNSASTFVFLNSAHT